MIRPYYCPLIKSIDNYVQTSMEPPLASYLIEFSHYPTDRAVNIVNRFMRVNQVPMAVAQLRVNS